MRGLVLAALIGAVAALLTWTKPGDTTPTGAPDTVVVQVLDNGFHTDLAVPREALVRRGGPLARAVAGLAPGDWILIGWGDAKFYVDQSPIADRLPDGARAFFRPGNLSVVMLDPVTADPRLSYGEDSATLTLTQAQFDRLAARVEASLGLSDGAPRIATARPGTGVDCYMGIGGRPPARPVENVPATMRASSPVARPSPSCICAITGRPAR